MQSSVRWYVVRTKVRQEAVALANLDRQDFKTYLPTIRVTRRQSGKWRAAAEPLFPGYLFVEVDVTVQSAAPIANTRGAIGLVRFGGEISPVPDGIVDGIMAMQSSRDTPIDPAQVFKQGDTVTIVQGPFSGVNAIFHAQSGKERVCLLLDLMGRSNRVEVSAHQIATA